MTNSSRTLLLGALALVSIHLPTRLAVAAAAKKAPTVAEAEGFIRDAETKLLASQIESSRAEWVQNNFVTGDTEAMAAKANEREIGETLALVRASRRFDSLKLPAELRRRFTRLRTRVDLATPADPAKAEKLTLAISAMSGAFGRGKYCSADGKDCRNIDDVTKIMADSRDPALLRDTWKGWHSTSRDMRGDFARYVALGNEGARELGYKDLGVLWRSKYEMDPDAFAREVDRLWEQVRPLYVALHTYVRTKLREKYGDAVPATGPIPAQLLGNVWSQEWTNVFPLVAPKGGDPGFDLSAILRDRKLGAQDMVRSGERFYTSLGFETLPGTFWERSLFTRPRDREVICHAEAFDIDTQTDVRIKTCIQPTAEDFGMIHHELGHVYYDLSYRKQPVLFRNGANQAFHEAIGDTVGLSITPDYLKEIGLLDRVPDPSKDIGLLLRQALEKVAFLPFGLVIDQWRWKVFSGEIPADHWNASWWELRRKYQGIVPPGDRTEADFDPGCKMHVAASVSYIRYFLAFILEFQFHRALAQKAGCTEPLHRCSIYGNAAAGEAFRRTLEMGASRPWTEALKSLTGSEQMDASAIRDYFAPLEKWLNEQNAGKPKGW